MPNSKTKSNSSTVTKAMKYSVITTFVNFNPAKFRPRTIIVNGVVAFHLKGNLYTKM